MVLSRPDEVRVAKEEGRLAVLLVAAVREVGAVVHGREGPEDAAVRQQHVGEDLDVQAPVARVVVHEHGVDFKGAGWVAGANGVGERAREGRVVGQELLREGPGLRVGGYDVAGGDHGAVTVSGRARISALSWCWAR